MEFDCTAITEQVGPLLSNGTALYEYVGCFLENNPSRQLATNIYTDTKNNTIDRCTSACYKAGWTFAGVQYSQECWCGDAIPLEKDNEYDCSYVCTGNANQTCGGNGYNGDHARMSLFADRKIFNGNTNSPPLDIPQSVAGYNYVGCYAESNGKAMNAKTYVNTTTMTVEMCQSYCAGFSTPYNFFALEYAQECYCGNAVNAQKATLTSDSGCMTMACRGNNSEYCGAASRAQVYQLGGTKQNYTAPSSSSTAGTASATSATAAPTVTSISDLSNYTYVGCFNETHDRRALNGLAANGGSKNTLNSCAASCLGYNYFGVEYGSECYCANDIYVNSIQQPTEAGCKTRCAGNSTQMCGGPDYLNIYYINATTVTPPSTTTAAGPPDGGSATATATVVPNPGGPTAVPSVGSYISLGCYNEGPNGRLINSNSYASDSNSVEACASFCSSYAYFGVEYTSECYCGNSLASGYSTADTSACSMPCAANENELCGGPGVLNLYYSNATGFATGPVSSGGASPTTAAPAEPTPANDLAVPARIGNYTSLGCYTEASVGRALSSVFANDSMTLEKCAAKANNAVAYFGVEYGRECWYGNYLDVTSNKTSQSDCSFQCPGNSSEACGAGNRLQLYYTNSTTAPSGGGEVSSALSCPGADNTIFTASTGDNYTIECGFDHSGGDMPNQPVSASRFEDAIEACSATAGCVDAAYQDGPNVAYLKSTVGSLVKNANCGFFDQRPRV
ncbi:hypothetical protein LTS18_004221 [Coniosporium uncinatum]|uniref:Uncharacterized protein n=1 Tax=Coniosporium uncinatum TaxID=93489 RepID=A0ACC3DSJ2_9PEZI|nr:hypothetical protein LTS18_004221 [Coniosporium uncinatum]